MKSRKQRLPGLVVSGYAIRVRCWGLDIKSAEPDPSSVGAPLKKK